MRVCHVVELLCDLSFHKVQAAATGTNILRQTLLVYLQGGTALVTVAQHTVAGLPCEVFWFGLRGNSCGDQPARVEVVIGELYGGVIVGEQQGGSPGRADVPRPGEN